jgi:hypothetical protein
MNRICPFGPGTFAWAGPVVTTGASSIVATTNKGTIGRFTLATPLVGARNWPARTTYLQRYSEVNQTPTILEARRPGSLKWAKAGADRIS